MPDSSPEKPVATQPPRQTHRALINVLVASTLVYIVAQWSAITNPYVIMDDVRQQTYWMQAWQDPALFTEDILSRYAREYVPWGVQALYYAASGMMNPVQFTKVVAGILFLVACGFMFGLALRPRDEFTAVAVVCTFFFFPGVLTKISGGLAQGFAYPLLIAYLFFLSRSNIVAAACVILVASITNPYIFMLCLVTHAIFLLRTHGPDLIRTITGNRGDLSLEFPRLIFQNLPVVAGVILMALKYIVFKSSEFGDIVTWAAMAGNLEYSVEGRTEGLPPPSLFHEVLVPWMRFFPFKDTAPFAFWTCLVATGSFIILAVRRPDRAATFRGLAVFGYVLPASLIMYVTSYLLLMKLFIPNRYMEFSLTVFYAFVLGVCISAAIGSLGIRKRGSPWVLAVLALLAGARNFNNSLEDYSSAAPLCQFLESLPKDSLIAGHPDVMDNVPTFGRRTAFLTYELSHPYKDRYWSIVKKRTYDLLDAYYSEDREKIAGLADYYGVDYLVVRFKDFESDSIASGRAYFEPFGSYIKGMAQARSHFAATDPTAFPIVFEQGDVRVIRIKPF